MGQGVVGCISLGFSGCSLRADPTVGFLLGAGIDNSGGWVPSLSAPVVEGVGALSGSRGALQGRRSMDRLFDRIVMSLPL